MFVANRTQPLQERRRCRDVAAFAQHGLDDDRRGVRWGGLLREQELQLIQRSAHQLRVVATRRGVKMMPVREWRSQHTRLAGHPHQKIGISKAMGR